MLGPSPNPIGAFNKTLGPYIAAPSAVVCNPNGPNGLPVWVGAYYDSPHMYVYSSNSYGICFFIMPLVVFSNVTGIDWTPPQVLLDFGNVTTGRNFLAYSDVLDAYMLVFSSSADYLSSGTDQDIFYTYSFDGFTWSNIALVTNDNIDQGNPVGTRLCLFYE